MAKYGNILTVFNADEPKKTAIKTILTNNGADFENIQDMFYLESNSKTNTKAIMDAIQATGIPFIFFHNNNSDGSVIRSGGMAQPAIDHVNKILFL